MKPCEGLQLLNMVQNIDHQQVFQMCSNKEAYFWWEHGQTTAPPLTLSLWPALRFDRHFHFDEETRCIKHETLEMEYELQGANQELEVWPALTKVMSEGDWYEAKEIQEGMKDVEKGGGERKAALKWFLDSIVLLFYYSTDEKVQDSLKEISQW